MKLLLDEMYDRSIAERLRARGHDVVAVTETALRGLPDWDLLVAMAREHRVIVTENAAHFVPLLRARVSDGVRSSGLLITSPRSLPRGRGTVGAFVRALERELVAFPGDGALDDQVRWLAPQ